MKKVMGAFSRFMCPKMKLFPAKFRCILEVFTLRGLWKKFWAHYHDLCVKKRSCLPWSSDAFCKFSPCKLYEESYGRIFTILRPIMKLFAVALRRILEVLRIQGWQKNVWVHFLKFSSKNKAVCCEVQAHFGISLPVRFAEKVNGRIFTIYVSKNEAVSCEVEMHLGSFHLAGFMKKVLGALSRLLRPKMKRFAV